MSRSTPEVGMGVARRLLVMCLVCGVEVCCWGIAAEADAASAAAGLNGALVVPGSPTEGEQVQAQEQASLSDPEVVAERETSATKFSGLDGEQAESVDGGAFPGLFGESGGAPRLPTGQRIVGYPSLDVAQVELPGSGRGVIEAGEPLAVETSPGERLAVDLSLDGVGGAYEPVRPAVRLRIPQELGEGVVLGDGGVSLTPVTAAGGVLAGAQGVVDGSSVFYANTQVDTDTVAKPLTLGVELHSVLRSADSPQQLFFRVGLPAGASLEQTGGQGSVRVVDEGVVLATVLTPSAVDAAGTPVPVSVSVAGSVVALTVARGAGEYTYPLDVDPTLVEKEVPGGWSYSSDTTGWCGGEDEGTKALSFTVCYPEGKPERGEFGLWSYATKGESQIDSVRGETSEHNGEFADSYLEIGNSSWEAGPSQLPVAKGVHELSVGSPSNGNYAGYEVIATASSLDYEDDFESEMLHPEVTVAQQKGPSASMDTTDEVVDGQKNALYGGRWASATTGSWGFELHGSDPGLGVQRVTWSSPNAAKWGGTESDPGCKGAQCEESWSPAYPLSNGTERLPEGEDTVEGKVEDPVGFSASTGTFKVKVDDAPPRNITLTGLPADKEISDGQRLTLKASATDGTKPTPSSGVASIVLMMDGRQIGSPSGGCSPGECTASGEWTLTGEGYAAGKQTLEVVATDNAGNVTRATYSVTVRHAQGVAVGPGSVNPVTGALSVNATDVSVSAPGGGLSVSRSYVSRGPAPTVEGPLGPQWSLSLGGQESLAKGTGSMVLTSAGGQQSVFTSSGGGGFTAPRGDAGMALSEKTVSGKVEFVLSDDGSNTTFTVPSGGSGGVWMPASSEGAGGTGVETFSYQTEGGVTEPTKVLAPVPAGVSCGLNRGCRALEFVYAKATTATGEGPSEWGEYAGRLMEVTYTAYEPVLNGPEARAVAKYAYDKQGRLRAEWNPQVSPPLKTVYGYDSEGHVTSVAPAGQQPWLVEQGTAAGDPVAAAGPGRVLAIARPPASSTTELKAEMADAPAVNTAAPTLSSTSPQVGHKISVSSNGTWSNSPLAFSYQWEDCSSAGKECVVIPGAVNQSYYPVTSDEGHTLIGVVHAINANGSVAASSAATALVAAGTPDTPLPEPPSVGSLAVWTIDYQVPLSGSGVPQMSEAEVAKWGQTDVPVEAAAVFPPDEPMGWPAKEYKHADVYYLDVDDRLVNTATPTGGVSTSEYNTYNDVVRTLSPDDRATALAAGEKSKELAKELDSESTYNETGSEPGSELLSTLGPKHTIELAGGTKAEAREHTVYSYNEGAPEGGPYHLVTKLTEGAQIAGKEESEVRTTKTGYGGQNDLGWKLRKPTSVTTELSSEQLVHSTFYEPVTGAVTETRMPKAGAPGEEQGYVFGFQFGKSGTEKGDLKEPQDIVVNTSGDEYVLDTANNRVEEFNAQGKLVTTFGETLLKEPRGIALDSEGDVWVANTGANNVDEFTSTGTYKTAVGVGEETPISPRAVAVSSTGVVWVAEGNEVTEYHYIKSDRRYYAEGAIGGKGSGETEMLEPQGVAIGAEGDIYVSDTGNDRIDEYSVKGEEAAKHVRNFGKEGTANGDLKTPYGIATDSSGDVWVADTANNRIEEFSPTGTFIQVFGKEGTGEGKLKAPKGLSIDSSADAWVADSANSNVQEWTAHGSGYGSGTLTAHDSQTIYYTAGANAKVTACGEHPQWADLPCQTQPAAQPEGSLPALPVTTYTYNYWDEPQITTSTSGSATRTTTDEYDATGRLKTSHTTSSVGTALPTVTYKYNEEQGALQEQSSEGHTITSDYNTLGQLTSYTDAAENTSTYEYDIDGRIKKTYDGKGTQTYTYSETTGLLSELADSSNAAMKFTASYDAEGNLLTEGYPNGMNADYAYDAIGQPTSLEYIKTTHCSESCKWFTDTVVPSIHNQWLEQTSSLSHQAYTYDRAGRLTQVQNTPTGKGCTTRIYAYDQDTNRTSLTTREPNSKGECASEGGSIEKHTYDQADRLNDSGVTYNAFGDITALPAADAEGSELTSEFFVDNQLASQKQNGETIGYTLDPAGRPSTVDTTGKTSADITNHYAGPGDSPAWTSNTSGETTRNIPGVSGTLAAVQSDLETPVLQLPNLHGDIIATAYLSETATGLASEADTSEFGVPTTSLPPKYSWLGALEVPTELPSGVTAMGARSYVPQLGRFLQPDPDPGGSANAYSYTFGDPVNTSDPSGETTFFELVAGLAAQVGGEAQAKEEAELAAKHAAYEAYNRAIAEEQAHAGILTAAYAAGPQYGEETEEWWEEEEGEYEYAAYHKDGSPEHQEARVEPAVLYQPLKAEAGPADGGEGGGGETEGFRIPIAGGCPSTKDPCYKHVRHHSGSANEGSACGRRSGCGGGGGNAGDTCRTVAGATGPLAVMTGPGGIILWVIGFGACSLN
jgi:RHS repeat-associated protein